MVERPVLTCLKCGYSWMPRTNELPGQCANKKCRSPHWDVVKAEGLATSAPARSNGHPHPTSTPVEQDMADCIDCKLKDRDLEQARKDLALAQAPPQKREREAEHLRLSGVLGRAKAGDCPDCKADLDAYNRDVIGKALEALTGEEAISLAVKKGGLPEKIMVQVS